MFLKSIIVRNYRRFIEEILDFEEDVTFIAGPNNSGKTSLMCFIKEAISDKNNSYCFEDLPLSVQKNFLELYYNELIKYKESSSQVLFEKSIESFLNENQIELRFNVGYNKENDDVALFSKYYMDLDEEMSTFYFSLVYSFNSSLFFTKLFENHSKLIDSVDLSDGDSKKRNIKKIISLLNSCMEMKIYYCDSNFMIKNQIEKKSDFLNLFNVKIVQANRPLDDVKDDRNNGLSSAVIKILKETEEWDKEKNDLIEQIEKAMTNITKNVQNTTDRALVEPLKQIEKTTGHEKTQITLSLSTKSSDLERFIIETMEAVYNVDGFQLSENSQGLGYSNLIFIHLLLEDFVGKLDNTKVNLFIVEEPESHMHPQMQRVFIKHLMSEMKKRNCQCLVSTHSNEVARVALMHRIRVIRKNNTVSSIKSLFDILKIDENVKTKEQKDLIMEIREFFDFFYDIAFSEIIFADKAIFYEGDTERLYIQNIIKNDPEFTDLSKDYISYIQVGGAYAHKYCSLLKLLNIPSLIITDIDYDNKLIESDKIKLSMTTNNALKFFYKESQKRDLTCCEDLYKWKNAEKNVINGLIYVAFQTDSDSYSRTLEEAMFCKKLSVDINYCANNKEWKNKKSYLNWDFSIPKVDDEKQKISIRDILKSMVGNKTNFMYSIVLNKDVVNTEPNYIKEGLKWLMK